VAVVVAVGVLGTWGSVVGLDWIDSRPGCVFGFAIDRLCVIDSLLATLFKTGIVSVPAMALVALFGLAGVLAAGAVTVSGAIPFVGLMAPNAARAVAGADARRVLPLAALIGCLLLLAADLVAQSFSIKPPIPSSAYRVGLPVGAVMAILGAPLLIYLIRRSTR